MRDAGSVVAVGWSVAELEAAFPGAASIDVPGIADIEAAVRLGARDGGVVAAVPPGSPALEVLVAELRRLGHVTVIREPPGSRPAPVDLPVESTALLDLLSGGLTLGEAATRLGMPRRTADRRLAQARRALGVATTAQAVTAARRRRAAAARGDVETATAPLVGRADELARLASILAADGAALLVGHGGVGKTALLRAATQGGGRRVWSAGGLRSMWVHRYWPLARAVGVAELVGDSEAIAARVEAAVGPDVLVVDDAHLVDEGTRDVLGALVGRVAMLVASRPDTADRTGGPGPADQLAAAGFEQVPVEPLTDGEAAMLVRALVPALPELRVRDVVTGAGGLPLLVEFLSGRDPDAPLGRDLVPQVSDLGPELFPAALRLALAGVPVAPDSTSDALVARQVAARRADGTIVVRHALVAEAIVAAADPAETVTAHRHLAEVTTDQAAAAQHWRAAGDPERATQAALTAAEGAHAPADRARLLALAGRCATGQHRGGRLLRAATALSEAGLHVEALRALDDVDEGCLSAQDLARTHLLRSRAQWHAGESEQATSSSRAGLALVAGSGTAVEAGLLVELVRTEALSSGIAAEHDTHLERARGIIGDGPGLAGLLSVAGILEYFRQDSANGWLEGRAAALVEDDADSLMRCSNNVIMWHESAGDPGAGLELALEMAADAAHRGLFEWRAQFQAMAANLLYHAGRFDEALRLLEVVEALAVDGRTIRQAQVCHASLLIDLGLLDAAESLMPPRPTRGSPDWMRDDSVHYLHAALAQASGRPRDALDLVEDLIDHDLSPGVILAFLYPVRAWAQHDLGLPVTEVASRSDLPVVQGLILEAHGVAALAGEPGRAADLLGQAAETGSRWTFGPALRARWGAAEALRRAGHPDAVARLLEVEQLVLAAGLEPLLVRVHRSLRLAGVPRSAPRALDRTGLLTQRERQVLDLVASGGSYAEVARRLGVGRPTVRRLLDNARMKLGAETRLAAVAAAQV